jgi:hypothetical protein
VLWKEGSCQVLPHLSSGPQMCSLTRNTPRKLVQGRKFPGSWSILGPVGWLLVHSLPPPPRQPYSPFYPNPRFKVLLQASF